MKILFLRKCGRDTIAAPRHYHAFEQAVAEIAECKWAGVGWPLYRADEPLNMTVERVMPDADWIIDRERDTELPENRDYRIACYLSDLHGRKAFNISGNVDAYIKSMNKMGYDAIFMRYLEIHGAGVDPQIFLDELKLTIYFLPWSIDTEEFKPTRKTTDIAFIGSMGGVYPLRLELWNHLPTFAKERNLELFIRDRPRGAKSFNMESQYERRVSTHIFGKRYARVLGDTRFFIFGCSKYRYPILKYFEAMASGCIVVANKPSNAHELGFIDGETYVEVTTKNWKQKLDYYLENSDEASRIGLEARKLIEKQHTHGVRAKDFIRCLEQHI